MKATAAAAVRAALHSSQQHYTKTARRINNSSYGRYSSNLISNFHPTVLSKCDDEEKCRHDHSRGFCQPLLPQSTHLLSRHLDHGFYSNYNSSNNSFSSLSTRRQYHTTPTPERYAAIVMTLGAIAATAKAGQYAVQGYNEWKEEAAAAAQQQQQQKEMEEREKMEQQGKEETTFNAEGGNTSGASSSSSGKRDGAQGKGDEKTTEGRRENIFASFFDMAIGSKYYEGESKKMMNIYLLFVADHHNKMLMGANFD